MDWSIHDEWLLWMKNGHIDELLGTGFFFEYRMVRILEIDETDGPTYAVQYFANSINEYYRFVEQQLPIITQKEILKWGGNFVSFSTIMEVVH